MNEVQDLQQRLKTVQHTKSDLNLEVDEQNSEISNLRSELTEWVGTR